MALRSFWALESVEGMYEVREGKWISSAMRTNFLLAFPRMTRPTRRWWALEARFEDLQPETWRRVSDSELPPENTISYLVVAILADAWSSTVEGILAASRLEKAPVGTQLPTDGFTPRSLPVQRVLRKFTRTLATA